jgi:hypothetical protein
VNKTRITTNTSTFDVQKVKFYEEGQVSRSTESMVNVNSGLFSNLGRWCTAIGAAFVPFNIFTGHAFNDDWNTVANIPQT